MIYLVNIEIDKFLKYLANARELIFFLKQNRTIIGWHIEMQARWVQIHMMTVHLITINVR